MADEKTERLQKLMARAGVASRRKCEELIEAGRVTVNGSVVTRLGTRVDPERDEVRVDGRPVRVGSTEADTSGGHAYVLLNKPAGVISAMSDRRGRKALGDLVPIPTRLYPVGRLDYDSEGLILLTNDGELANLLTHPRYEHKKEYRVVLTGQLTDEALDRWRRGVMLDDRPTTPAQVEVMDRSEDRTVLRVVMHEGRKRQIRRVADLLGYPVRELVRVRIGPLKLGGLAAGQWRYLTEREIEHLVAIKEREE